MSLGPSKATLNAVEREGLLLAIRHVIKPDDFEAARAIAGSMSLPKVHGFIRLLCAGDSIYAAADHLIDLPDTVIDGCGEEVDVIPLVVERRCRDLMLGAMSRLASSR